MIYISSACVRNQTIGASVRQLAEAGYTAIELSGGTQPYPEMEAELLALKEAFNLKYVCHNYFPPPAEPFVINLASLDDDTHRLSLENIERAIALSKKLGVPFFGFHAGFLINIPVSQIGKSIDQQELFDADLAMARFTQSLGDLTVKHPDFKLYVENNVLAGMNYSNFGGRNPFFLTTAEEMDDLQNRQPFHLLLDVAHLKVSCQTLGLDFVAQLERMIQVSDYIHISDNDGSADTNGVFRQGSALHEMLLRFDFADKHITLETYGGLGVIAESFETVKTLRNA